MNHPEFAAPERAFFCSFQFYFGMAFEKQTHVWFVRTSSVEATGCTHVNASLDISSVKTPKSWCTMQTPEIYGQVLCFGGPNEKTCQWWVEDGWGWLCLWWLSWSSSWSWSSWIPSKRQQGLSPIPMVQVKEEVQELSEKVAKTWHHHHHHHLVPYSICMCILLVHFILIWWLPKTSMPWLSPFSSRFFLVVSMFFCIHTHKWFAYIEYWIIFTYIDMHIHYTYTYTYTHTQAVYIDILDLHGIYRSPIIRRWISPWMIWKKALWPPRTPWRRPRCYPLKIFMTELKWVYPLVNVNKKLWKDPPFYSWVNPL